MWPFTGCDEVDKNKAKTIHKDSLLKRYLGRWESYSVMAQSILIWENPVKSSIALLVINVFYW